MICRRFLDLVHNLCEPRLPTFCIAPAGLAPAGRFLGCILGPLWSTASTASLTKPRFLELLLTGPAPLLTAASALGAAVGCADALGFPPGAVAGFRLLERPV